MPALCEGGGSCCCVKGKGSGLGGVEGGGGRGGGLQILFPLDQSMISTTLPGSFCCASNKGKRIQQEALFGKYR